MPRFSKQRLWSRGILITGLLIIVWYNTGKKNEQPFASFHEDITAKAMKTRCSQGHEAAVKPFPSKITIIIWIIRLWAIKSLFHMTWNCITNFSECVPKQCGRFVVDNLFSPQEMYFLRDFMSRIFEEMKVEGAATVFDFHLGRLQFEGDSANLYQLNSTKQIFQKGDQLIYQ